MSNKDWRKWSMEDFYKHFKIVDLIERIEKLEENYKDLEDGDHKKLHIEINKHIKNLEEKVDAVY